MQMARLNEKRYDDLRTRMLMMGVWTLGGLSAGSKGIASLFSQYISKKRRLALQHTRKEGKKILGGKAKEEHLLFPFILHLGSYLFRCTTTWYHCFTSYLCSLNHFFFLSFLSFSPFPQKEQITTQTPNHMCASPYPSRRHTRAQNPKKARLDHHPSLS